jgi:Sulfotransferase family
MPAPFPFIVGCGRSGTTLVRAILDSHPELAVVHESRFIPSMLSDRDRLERDGGLDLDRFVEDLFSRRTVASRVDTWDVGREELRAELEAARPGDVPSAIRVVYRAYADRRGKPLYGDKTPGYVRWIDVIGEAFPEARFVHVVRDGRDVALALREVDFGPADLVQAAHTWRRKVLGARQAGQGLGPERYLELRYEDLVRDPESTARTLCSFLDLDYVAGLVEPGAPAASDGLDGLGRQQHHASLARPITPGLRDWRKQMAPSDARRYEEVAADALMEYGYEVSVTRASGPRHWAATTARVARGRMIAYRRARRRSRSGGR